MANHLEKLRKQGNFTPQSAFKENNIIQNNKQSNFNEEKHINDDSQSTERYIPGKNQRKTLKVSPQTKAEVEELKRELRMGFNYEVIQYLIDTYVHDHLTPHQQQRFRENSEI